MTLTPGHLTEDQRNILRAVACGRLSTRAAGCWGPAVVAAARDHYLSAMKNLELPDEQTAARIRELHDIVQNDRHPLSPRIVALKEILGMLRPDPERRCRCPTAALRAVAPRRYRRRRG